MNEMCRENDQIIKLAPKVTALKPVSRLSSLGRRFPIVSSWRAASTFVCDMPDGDGGPDGPVASLVDFERTGPRSSPKVMEVMESSLTPRRGELGLSGKTVVDTVLSAVAVGEL